MAPGQSGRDGADHRATHPGPVRREPSFVGHRADREVLGRIDKIFPGPGARPRGLRLVTTPPDCADADHRGERDLRLLRTRRARTSAAVPQRIRIHPRVEQAAHRSVPVTLRRARPRPTRTGTDETSRRSRTRCATTRPTRSGCSTRSAGPGAGSSECHSAAWSPRSSR